ncbi:MAG: polyamine aminopropyltransferase [Gammaproteobacteria bacterium]|nr:polyamine aminopropyltransferase [Gammaproteobacteria bacterium]MDH5803202.1 polyamine aminopropyltransferase [Gammaproteobacteria bacterium]
MGITAKVDDRANTALLFATFVIAVCGLIYELLAGTVSSYLLGDSVYQFSIVIGLFMAAMGVGSYLSRFVTASLAETFITLQIVIGLIGGFSAFALFYAFTYVNNYQLILFLISVSIGALVGCEIPIVIRLLKEYQVLRLNVSNVLTADYLGALAASLLFPIILVPQLGIFRSALLFGCLNVFVSGLGLYTFRDSLKGMHKLSLGVVAAALLLGVGFYFVKDITGFFQSRLYTGEIIFSKTTSYQDIVVTRDGDVFSLFINGNLQFNSLDEYRYHESLVHPVMSLARRHNEVLVLGGGDGLAVRELLKYSDVDRITLVDLDPEITRLFRDNPMLYRLNQQALRDPKVHIVNQDAWKYVEQSREFFDVVIIDLPDPSQLSLSKLYSRSFYKLLANRLGAGGHMVTQATSPMYARDAFWCINKTLQETPSSVSLNTQLSTLPYHAYVPSFGEWGFVIASTLPPRASDISINVETKFLDAATLTSMVIFPPDMTETDVQINTIDSHKLAAYYAAGWKRWFH